MRISCCKPNWPFNTAACAEMAEKRREAGRFFSANAQFLSPLAFVFDLICLLLLAEAYIDLRELDGLRDYPERFIAASSTFAPLAGAGLYLFRIATYIAWLRGNRAPQNLERALTATGLAIAFLCLFGTAFLTRLYVEARGYVSCGAQPGGGHYSSGLLFVRKPGACPSG